MPKCAYCRKEFLIKDLYRVSIAKIACQNCIDKYFLKKYKKDIKNKEVFRYG